MAKIEEYIPQHYVGKRVPVRLDTGDETLVEQHHEETTNINKIIGRYRRGAPLPQPTGQEQYADVSEVGELHEIRLQMNAALEAYSQLPEEITSQFENAGHFVEYCETQRMNGQPLFEAQPRAAQQHEEPPEPPAEAPPDSDQNPPAA